MENQCKILISYHKKDHLFKDDVLTPIHAGRDNAIKNNNPNLEWLTGNMIGDNTGENISERNGSYNEMSSVYWAWKNYEDLGDPDWIGFMHYRRHFQFCGGQKSCYEHDGIGEAYLEEIGYSPEKLDEILSSCDFVTTKPQWRSSMYEHFKRNHNIKDLDCAIRILKEKYPEYASAADTYLKGPKAYFCNMFIFPKKVFFEYAKWIFDILFAFEKEIDISKKRLFISEWLTGIFIQKLIDDGKKGAFFPTVFTEGEVTIPVILAADENYAEPMSVTITSLLVNAKKTTKYDIYILVPEEFSEITKHQILNYEILYPGCKITFIDFREEFNDVIITSKHLSKVTFYRLLAASLLPDYKKCIYLDVDTIVNTDLSLLYRNSLDGCYVGGVKAAGYYYPLHWAERHSKDIGLPSIEQYINAGVLLIDLEQIRENDLEETFLKLSKMRFSSEDQDIINVACFDHIKHLHLKFNLMTKYFEKKGNSFVPNDILRYVFSDKEIHEALDNPVIIHYANKEKPWSDPNIFLADYWWKYAELSPLMMPKAQDQLKMIAQLQRELADLRRRYNKLEHGYNCTKNSVSLRIGRIITYIPRKIRGGIRCFKQHGLEYTVHRFFEKIQNKLRK